MTKSRTHGPKAAAFYTKMRGSAGRCPKCSQPNTQIKKDGKLYCRVCHQTSEAISA